GGGGGGGEGDIAAGQGLEPAVIGEAFAAPVAGFLAQGFGVVVDAGDVLAGVDGWVMAVHQSSQPCLVEDDSALIAGAGAELFEAAGGFVGGGAGQCGVFVGVDGGQEVFAAGEGLLVFDFGTESGFAGAG
ncbi:hypothetical protein AMK27_40105, partial [Streptomyces sp. CB02009]